MSQAKKWKRTQLEDPVKHQQERQRGLLRHRKIQVTIPIDVAESEERRRQRDTEAHKNARRDPERRREE